MDIHLNDGIIFDLFEDFELKSPIIFTTAYDQYAIKAFKQNSIDYLLKPIDANELKAALEKFKNIYKTEVVIDMQLLSNIIKNDKRKSSYKNRIRVKIGDRYKSFPFTEITNIYSQDKITFIHTEEGRSYPIDYSIEVISNGLDPDKFFRANRSHVLNIDFIEEVISYSNSRLKVSVARFTGLEIIVAREKVKDFKEWLDR